MLTRTDEVLGSLTDGRWEVWHAVDDPGLCVALALVIEWRAPHQKLVHQHAHSPAVNGVAVVQVLFLLVLLRLALVGALQHLQNPKIQRKSRGDVCCAA